jgi:diguanylate cyclase (GGDEF)-like protein/PAS domain S-box-containing protein
MHEFSQGWTRGRVPADDLLHALPTPVVTLDANGYVDFANPAAARLFGRPVVGSKFTDLVEPDDRPAITGYLHSLQESVAPDDSRYATCTVRPSPGHAVHVAINGCSLHSFGRRGVLLSLTDITARSESDDKVLSRALTDELTGLPNRRLFSRSLRAAIQAGQGCVVALADIDGFKLVNDTFGHLVGDQVLAVVANRLRNALPESVVIARMGGDEFSILIPGVVDDHGLRQLEALRQMHIEGELGSPGPETVSMSIGVTHTTAGEENEVLRQSDIAMYAAKRSGKAQVAVYGEAAAEVVKQSQSITSLVENLRQQNERLRNEARTDVRTGLANSRALSEVESVVVGSAGSDWATCGVLFVDIDHFGAFNHLYGDRAGDLALKRVADALQSACRKTDLAFRKGGEEFVIVLPQAEPDAVRRVAESAAASIDDMKIQHAEGPTGWLSALIVGTSVSPAQTIGDAVARAGDETMRLKATGIRARVVLLS